MTKISEKPQNVALDPSRYDVLIPLMEKVRASCSPRDFYWAVNSAFHAAEAGYYDDIHAEMFEEIVPVWKKLLAQLPDQPARLEFLDLGCGTGMVGELLNKFCPDRIATLHMLDPSAEMIEKARLKSKRWSFRCEFHHGDIQHDDLPAAHVVTANSVLHHVVELEELLARIQSLVRPNGVFLSAHDPRNGAESDTVLQSRRAAVAAQSSARKSGATAWRKKFRSLARSGVKRVLRIKGTETTEEATNRSLLEDRVIQSPLELADIWAVTDFHVPDQPGAFGHGIDRERLEQCLTNMTLRLTVTYQFHDTRRKNLTG